MQQSRGTRKGSPGFVYLDGWRAAQSRIRGCATGPTRSISGISPRALLYNPIKHIIRHFYRFVGDAAKHGNICRVVSLQAQCGFFLCHFQMAVQHLLPRCLAPTRVYAGQKPGDFVRIGIPSFPRGIGFAYIGVFGCVHQIGGNEQVLREELLKLTGCFLTINRGEQLRKILWILEQPMGNRL